MYFLWDYRSAEPRLLSGRLFQKLRLIFHCRPGEPEKVKCPYPSPNKSPNLNKFAGEKKGEETNGEFTLL